MKFEKRADGGDVTPSPETPDTGKKPVIIYILILFLAAFMLMFLSLLAHQRSNSEALGQLPKFRLRYSGDPDQSGAGH